jgi:hypothetical protein
MGREIGRSEGAKKKIRDTIGQPGAKTYKYNDTEGKEHEINFGGETAPAAAAAPEKPKAPAGGATAAPKAKTPPVVSGSDKDHPISIAAEDAVNYEVNQYGDKVQQGKGGKWYRIP